jgi:hypothetical protein
LIRSFISRLTYLSLLYLVTVSERLFAQFDVKGTGYIDFEEFITGLAIVCR